MEKRKTTIIFVIGVMLIVSTFLICHKHTVYQTQLDEVKLKDIKDNNMFAIMVKGENGEYSTSDEFPGTGYIINKEKSGCMDNNNQLIPNSLSYDEKEQKVIVNTGQTTYCYLYFDKSNAKELIQQLRSTQGLSDAPVGGMYRYQGTNADNYICLKEVGKANCTDKSDEMYRIIGITSEGNMKVIKQTKYNNTNYKWDTKYSVNSSDSSKDYYCTEDDCPTWEQSEIYQTLNDTFYNSLNDNIQKKIEPQRWWYGDIGWDYLGTLTTAEEVYEIESGQASTQYYDRNGTLVSTSQEIKWTKTSKKAPIGLMYLHDYYYQSKQGNCQSDKNPQYTNCQTQGWMHMKNNGNSLDDEWIMTRIGRWDKSNNNFGALLVRSSGSVYENSLKTLNAIRPVFYLSSGTEIQGNGTSDDPFYIVS